MLPAFGNSFEETNQNEVGVVLDEHADFKPSPLTDYSAPGGGYYSAVIGGRGFFLEKEAEKTSPAVLQPVFVSDTVPPGTITQIAEETGHLVVQNTPLPDPKPKQVGRGDERAAGSEVIPIQRAQV